MNWAVRLLILIALVGVAVSFGLYEGARVQERDTRFVKLDMQGNKIDPWAGPWSCVLDTETGLIWENKTDDESIHDALWTFSWYQDEKGVQNSGDCFFESERCDTADLIRRANQEKTCGLDGWRLPSAIELESILFDKPKTGEAKIANDFFTYTKRGDYWTSDADIVLEGVFAHLKLGAIAIDFIEGKPRAIPYRNAAFVRLVAPKNSTH